MQHARSSVGRPWLWGAVLFLFVGCAKTAPTARDTVPASPASATSTSSAASSATPSADSELAPSAPCGLPSELLARGWPRELSPTSPRRPDLAEPSDVVKPAPHTAFTVGVIPDTQYYTLCRNQHFAAQARWLAQHAEDLGLQAAIHLGDITESNTPEEWTFARNAIAPLWERLPTFLTTGNHDYGDGGTANRRHTLFSEYFSHPPAATQRTVAETLEPDNLENAYYRLQPRAAKPGVTPFTLGVLVIEWSPRGKTVEWADRILGKYPKDRVIFVTHAYLYHDSTRYDWATKGKEQEWNPHAYGEPHLADKQPADVFDGEKLWKALLSKHSNVFLTLNGHVLGDGTGLLTSRGARGNLVHQVLANYQMLNEGGLGYLRLLEFDEDGTTLRMRSYSPSLGVWATSPDQHFDLAIAPPLW